MVANQYADVFLFLETLFMQGISQVVVVDWNELIGDVVLFGQSQARHDDRKKLFMSSWCWEGSGWLALESAG